MWQKVGESAGSGRMKRRWKREYRRTEERRLYIYRGGEGVGGIEGG